MNTNTPGTGQPELSQLDALRSEVAALRAHEAIRQRIFAYARALDRLDRSLLEAQFWEDAQVDYGAFYRGAASDFVEVALKFQAAMSATQHLIGNIYIEADSDHAFAESYVYAHHTIAEGPGEVHLLVGGRYLDRLERRGREWKLSFRTEVLDWGRRVPMTERWLETNNELPSGKRDLADLSYRIRSRIKDA